MRKNGVMDLVVPDAHQLRPGVHVPGAGVPVRAIVSAGFGAEAPGLRETDDVRRSRLTVKALPAPKPPVVEAAKPVEALKPALSRRRRPPALSVVPAAPAPTPRCRPASTCSPTWPPPQSVADLNDDELARSLGL